MKETICSDHLGGLVPPVCHSRFTLKWLSVVAGPRSVAPSSILHLPSSFLSWLLVLACMCRAPAPASAQGVYGQWFNTSRGTVPESAIGAALDISTNVYVLGRFYAQTNKVGATILTNTLATSMGGVRP